MITLIVLLSYIGNIFLNRWLNKIVHKKANLVIVPGLWFVPILMTLVLIIIILADFLEDNKFSKWFKGDYW